MVISIRSERRQQKPGTSRNGAFRFPIAQPDQPPTLRYALHDWSRQSLNNPSSRRLKRARKSLGPGLRMDEENESRSSPA